MAAVAYPMTGGHVRMRPPLVSVSGGRPDRRPLASVYRRRRAVALVALVATVLVAIAAGLVVRGALAGSGGGPLSATRSASVPLEPAAAHIHIVQPGDTLWSIVAAGGGRGDPRPAVDRLQAELGGRPLQVGQRLLLP
jgi:hypothetical protein